jgi:hypothetical protein
MGAAENGCSDEFSSVIASWEQPLVDQPGIKA